MRRQSSRARDVPCLVRVKDFGWDPALSISLRHTTLPWTESVDGEFQIEASPLAVAARWGERDRLSLVAQFAAHQAFLRFAGLTDISFEADHWRATRRRQSDARLIRVGARPSSEAEVPPLTMIEELADVLGVTGLQSMIQSWVRPESVYREIRQRLETSTAADLSALRSSAMGAFIAPGEACLRALGRRERRIIYYRQASTIATATSYLALGQRREVLHAVGATPLRPYSALDALGLSAAGEEEEVVEGIRKSFPHGALVIVTEPDRFDSRSRRVVRLLSESDAAFTWLIPAGCRELLGTGLPIEEEKPTHWFVLSEKLVPLRELERQLEAMPFSEAANWLERFVHSERYLRFLEQGLLVDSPMTMNVENIPEPKLSYLAALALVGREIRQPVAERFLSQLGCRLPLSELMLENVLLREGGRLTFASAALHRSLAQLVPVESRPGLCLLAASVLDENDLTQAMLFYEGGDRAEAIRILTEDNRWRELSSHELLARLAELPAGLLECSEPLLRQALEALIATGRYVDARNLCGGLPHAAKSLCLARVERRLGDYATAAALLDALPIEERNFRSEILAGEVARLLGRIEAAGKYFAAAERLVDTAEERIRLGYEKTMLAYDGSEEIDSGWAEVPGYFSSRYRAYAALRKLNYGEAAHHAEAALGQAVDVPQRIDALLDLVYARFLSGDWEEARRSARQALIMVEETQGDRAAGGILYTLGYLCADAGQTSAASHAIERLHRFYRSVDDQRRLGEVDLLVAQLALVKGEFAASKRHALRVAAAEVPAEIREAALLIADEVDWIIGPPADLRSAGRSSCLELRDRHALTFARAGFPAPPIHGEFSTALLSFETRFLNGEPADPPAPQTSTEKHRLYRSLTGLIRRRPDGRLLRRWEDLARELDLSLPSMASTVTEHAVRVFELAASEPFPFRADAFGEVDWRYATRNRFGQWAEIGSLPALQNEELTRMSDTLAADWHVCADDALLFIEGSSLWPDSSQRSIALLFRLRSEHWNLQRAAEQERMTIADGPQPVIEGLIGSSSVMQDLMTMISKVAKSDVAVCILGESGTGKELVARAIHRHSARRSRPFTPVNCAALPENLIESELFGHVRGAFTGADRDRAGLIEVSDGGTLFLDEIGEMPLPAQAKLLRFLQEGEFRRVGDPLNRQADVRVVAATNRKLERAVDEGRFREDLYYRIRGIELVTPPLRERGSDILVIARHILAEEKARQRRGPDRFASDVETILLGYSWPGNVRELQNTVRAAFAIAGEARQVEHQHLPERLRGLLVVRSQTGMLYEELNRFRRSLIQRSLDETRGNQNQAAKRLGVSRQTLAYQIRELGIMVRP